MQKFYRDNQEFEDKCSTEFALFAVYFKSLTLTFSQLAKIYAYIERVRRTLSIYAMSF